jgi:hypothetical protein
MRRDDEERLLSEVARQARRGHFAPRVRSLGSRLRLSERRLLELAQALCDQDQLVLWATPVGGGGVAVTLTAMAMHSLGITFHDRTQRHAAGREVLESELGDDVSLDQVAESSDASPLTALMRIEDAARIGARVEGYRADYSVDHYPRPLLFLGQRLQWPVPGQLGTIATGPCAGCLDKTLSTVTYCLICDRSGNARLLPTVPVVLPEHKHEASHCEVDRQ